MSRGQRGGLYGEVPEAGQREWADGNRLFSVSADDALWRRLAYGEEDASARIYFSVWK